jgi:hypothetical protein
MATTRSFSAMLNEYLTDELLMEELVKRDYFMNKIAKQEDWKGGDLIVPFRGAQASSVKHGGLTASTDIAQSKFVRGKINAYKEIWGSLIFNETDLQQHDGKIPESTFLKLLPDEIDNFMDYFKQVSSFQMGCGPHMATVTDSTNAATGVFVVDRIDRCIIDQKLQIDDDNSSPLDAYVIAVNVNTSEVTLSDSRGGSAFNFGAYTLAQNAKLYYDGVTSSTAFVSIRQALLSAANGGASTLHGQTKTAYPFLQAVNVSGASITASNILEKLFDAYVTCRIKARGKADTLVMSYKHWGSIMKSQQIEKGAYKIVGDPKRSEYGWHETVLASTTKGEVLTIAGVQEMDDDVIFGLDWKSMKFMSNGGFKKRRDPEDGKLFYTVRNETGYQYIVDTCLFGEMRHDKPGNNLVVHSIPNY